MEREFPEFSWLGKAISEIQGARLSIARTLVCQGFDPKGIEVAKALGIDPASIAARAVRADIQRRARRHRGDLPAGKSKAERRAHVAVRILCRFFARLLKPSVRLPDGSPLPAPAAELLAKAGLELAQDDPSLERHPRAKGVEPAHLAPESVERLQGRLAELDQGELRGPLFSEKPLPDQPSSATRRNHRRQQEARVRYQEAQRYQRQTELARKAAAAGQQVVNPAGVKPMPLHEGRKARQLIRDRFEALRFLKGIPNAVRVALVAGATKGTGRGLFSAAGLHVVGWFAFLYWQATDARPSMRRSGFSRAVEGLPREALARAFAWSATTEEPFHANTLSHWVKRLESVGLVMRETPNGQADAYKGTTGWALNVYRLRTVLDLRRVLKALGFEALLGLEPAALLEGADPAPS